MENQWIDGQVEKTWQRLYPRLHEHFSDFATQSPEDWLLYSSRLKHHFPRLFRLLFELYYQESDFVYYLEHLLSQVTETWIERRPSLKKLDEKRLTDMSWFDSNQMLGGVCYVDLYAESLNGLKEKIPYFKELGLTYLHLMPLYASPEAQNDGGYAVSSYRKVNPQLGSLEDLVKLADELRQQGISLALDFVFNHTSDEHEWARRALVGEKDFQDYYWIFPDRNLPDMYDRTLREIFPEEHPGSFSYRKEIDGWVWTTFHAYQWDLNYRNPAVFNEMALEMLFLANLGVEVLRLDALAFLWKEMGTSCENLPQAHLLIQAFNAVASIAAPAMVFKSEAIVHPDEVVKYIHPKECQLSYNPLLMALLWESLATRKVELLKLALEERFQVPTGSVWVNYIRSHDDIGWTFSDEDAVRLGINGFDHRQFLNEFYTGSFPGSFASGISFQENPKTGDARVSGTTASLAGLESAILNDDAQGVEHSIRRIVLIHSIVLSLKGIPLLYLGDEVGKLNDYSYQGDNSKADDSRWVHRGKADWTKVERRLAPDSIEGQVFKRLSDMIILRKNNQILARGELKVLELTNPHVLGFLRIGEEQSLLILANFSEATQTIRQDELSTDEAQNSFILAGDISLNGYQFLIV